MLFLCIVLDKASLARLFWQGMQILLGKLTVVNRQVLDLYATSVDYDPNSSESVKFFKIVQNKLHFAAHGQTAAEVI